MAKEYTSIRVSTDAKEVAEQAKQEGETWDEYIQRCSNNPPEIREYVDVSDMDRQQTIDVEDARLLAQHVDKTVAPYFCDVVGVDDASEIRAATVGGDASKITYDDMVQACRKAIRDELPTERMG